MAGSYPRYRLSRRDQRKDKSRRYYRKKSFFFPPWSLYLLFPVPGVLGYLQCFLYPSDLCWKSHLVSAGFCAVLSHSVVSDSLWPPWTVASVHGDSPSKNTDVGCHALLQGIFLTQGSNPGLSHCGQILYHLSHQGSPRILGWVACSFFRGSSQPRNQTRVACIAGGFFTSWAPGEAHAGF